MPQSDVVRRIFESPAPLRTQAKTRQAWNRDRELRAAAAALPLRWWQPLGNACQVEHSFGRYLGESPSYVKFPTAQTAELLPPTRTPKAHPGNALEAIPSFRTLLAAAKSPRSSLAEAAFGVVGVFMAAMDSNPNRCKHLSVAKFSSDCR